MELNGLGTQAASGGQSLDPAYLGAVWPRMSDLSARRGFLRGLAHLPLIRGGVTILGNQPAPPSCAAVVLSAVGCGWREEARLAELTGP
jgi:hypothetical protein